MKPTYYADIYHLTESIGFSEYGLPTPDEYTYSQLPDITLVPCYYYAISNIVGKLEPGKDLENIYKFIFYRVDEDIKLNDRVVVNGQVFTLETPVRKHKSHIEVRAVLNGDN